MKLNRLHHLVPALFAFALALNLQQAAHATNEATRAQRQQMENRVQQAAAAAAERRQFLFEHYAAAVERVANQLRSQGDTEGATKASNEVFRAREQRQIGGDDFEALAELRERMRFFLHEADLTEAQALLEAHNTYFEYLAQRIQDLYRFNNNNEADALLPQQQEMAVAVRRDQEKVDQLQRDQPTAPGLVAPSAPPSAPPASPPMTPGTQEGYQFPEGWSLPEPDYELLAELRPGNHLITKMALMPDRYRLRATYQVGERQTTATMKRGHLYIGPGTEIVRGGLYTIVGTTTIDSARFERVEISQALQGRTSAKGAIFDECDFVPISRWRVTWWCTKWEFENCVFHRSFLREWSSFLVGVKLNDCTFYNVEFPTMVYKEDAGKEAVSEWRTIKNCRFVDCKIPISVLLATENCVFENCQFFDDDDKSGGVKSPLNVTIFYTGNTPPELPPVNPLVIVRAQPVGLEHQTIGSDTFYDNAGARINFR